MNDKEYDISLNARWYHYIAAFFMCASGALICTMMATVCILPFATLLAVSITPAALFGSIFGISAVVGTVGSLFFTKEMESMQFGGDIFEGINRLAQELKKSIPDQTLCKHLIRNFDGYPDQLLKIPLTKENYNPRKSPQLVQFLIDQGVKPEYLTKSDKSSSLASAVQRGDLTIVNLLLKHGANPNFILQTKDGDKNLLELAGNNKSIKEMLTKVMNPEIAKATQPELPNHINLTIDPNISTNQKPTPSPKYYAKVVPDDIPSPSPTSHAARVKRRRSKKEEGVKAILY